MCNFLIAVYGVNPVMLQVRSDSVVFNGIVFSVRGKSCNRTIYKFGKITGGKISFVNTVCVFFVFFIFRAELRI